MNGNGNGVGFDFSVVESILRVSRGRKIDFERSGVFPVIYICLSGVFFFFFLEFLDTKK